MIYLGVLATAAIGYFLKGGYNTAAAKLDFVISIITWIGLFGYVTNNQILNPLVWKCVFVGGLLWDIIFSFFQFKKEAASEEISEKASVIIFTITAFIFIGPLYFGLFNYAFR